MPQLKMDNERDGRIFFDGDVAGSAVSDSWRRALLLPSTVRVDTYRRTRSVHMIEQLRSLNSDEFDHLATLAALHCCR